MTLMEQLPVVIQKSHEVAKRHGLWPVSFSDFQCHFESREEKRSTPRRWVKWALYVNGAHGCWRMSRVIARVSCRLLVSFCKQGQGQEQEGKGLVFVRTPAPILCNSV